MKGPGGPCSRHRYDLNDPALDARMLRLIEGTRGFREELFIVETSETNWPYEPPRMIVVAYPSESETVLATVALGEYKRCRYCLGGYCLDADVQSVELTANGGRTWDYPTEAGRKCREYLHGQYRMAKA